MKANKITGPNAGGPRQLPIRTSLAARLGQFWLHCMSMSPASPNRRRAVLIGIVALVLFGFVHAGILIADSDRSWSSWLTPFGFWVVAFLAYKFELDKHDDAA